MRNKIASVLSHVNTVTLWISGAAIFFMTILGALDVFSMALFRQPIYSTVEMTETLMVFVVYLALGTVHAKKAHIATDLIYVRFPKRVKEVVDVVILSLMTLFFVLLTWSSWFSFSRSFRVKEYSVGLINFPIYPTRFFLAIGVTIALIWCIVDLIIPAIRKDKPEGPIIEM
jgi:TRAP-type C4-dicarboxylate transport system permease small subunit